MEREKHKPNSKEKELYELLVKHFESYGIKSNNTEFKIMYSGKDNDGDDMDLSLTLYKDRYETEWDYDSDEGYYDQAKRDKEIEELREKFVDAKIENMKEMVKIHTQQS